MTTILAETGYVEIFDLEGEWEPACSRHQLIFEGWAKCPNCQKQGVLLKYKDDGGYHLFCQKCSTDGSKHLSEHGREKIQLMPLGENIERKHFYDRKTHVAESEFKKE